MEKSMRGKRGLSEVLATLMIILLVLIAIGIIWLVVRSVVQSGADDIEINQKCLNVQLEAVGVVANVGGGYDVTLRRGADSETDLAGVKVLILSGNTAGTVEDFVITNLVPLGTATDNIGGPANADHVEFTAFFEDRSGNEQLCSQTNTFYF